MTLLYVALAHLAVITAWLNTLADERIPMGRQSGRAW